MGDELLPPSKPACTAAGPTQQQQHAERLTAAASTSHPPLPCHAVALALALPGSPASEDEGEGEGDGDGSPSDCMGTGGLNKSRYRGVSYDRKKAKWRVQIKVS